MLDIVPSSEGTLVPATQKPVCQLGNEAKADIQPAEAIHAARAGPCPPPTSQTSGRKSWVHSQTRRTSWWTWRWLQRPIPSSLPAAPSRTQLAPPCFLQPPRDRQCPPGSVAAPVQQVSCAFAPAKPKTRTDLGLFLPQRAALYVADRPVTKHCYSDILHQIFPWQPCWHRGKERGLRKEPCFCLCRSVQALEAALPRGLAREGLQSEHRKIRLTSTGTLLTALPRALAAICLMVLLRCCAFSVKTLRIFRTFLPSIGGSFISYNRATHPRESGHNLSPGTAHKQGSNKGASIRVSMATLSSDLFPQKEAAQAAIPLRKALWSPPALLVPHLSKESHGRQLQVC